ncbi:MULTISPECIES: hypothetical protein [unclassified Providencia]|uniref:hypothetical protein n=1 Tax=unclassified Providencia TaxID=2633465 RepID=UPI0012B646D2|nr:MULTISPECIES: hypothetical protein [unclassified Providencia]MTC21854.1 hypothetical protein [Providencia sp. wls1938]
MEFKGTPAPWIISDSGHSIMDSEQFIFADVRRHAILCRWHEKGFEYWDDEGASKDIGIETKQANANLIAAAPELLKALRELIQTHEYSLRIGYERIIELGGDCDSPELMINKDSSLNKAKAAIAKALGQQ